MKIGLLRGGGSLVPGHGCPSDWKIFNFRNIRSGWSNFDLPYSAFATPARYLAEMIRRLSNESPGKGYLIFNPFLEPSQNEIALVLQRVRFSDELSEIIIDCNGIPIAYRLPANGLPELGRMALLSCIDGAIDAKLLGHFMGKTVQIWHEPAIDVSYTVGNGYSFHHATQRVLRWMGESALSMVEKHLEQVKDIPPVFALLPYHAGDLLFFALAHQRTSTPSVSGVVIARQFEDVVKAADAGMPTRLIDLANTRSNGDPAWENAQFDHIVSALADDLLYYYCRPLRPYDAAEYHLLDQYAFAIGHDGCSSLIKTPCEDYTVRSELSVLLHFDGGWPLKIYPHRWRQELIELLARQGYRITTLTDDPEMEFSTHRNTHFTGLGALKELIGQHSILVGMDSFPCHFAAHVMGAPAICLFAATQPVNSDAPASSRYLALEQHLPCRPCGAHSICPLDGSEECSNFVAPEMVIEAMEKMRIGLRGENG